MPSLRRSTEALRTVLAAPGDLRRVLLTYGQSALGDAAAGIALLLVAYVRLHSPWAITVVLIADFAPRILLAPIAGVLADIGARRAVLVGADLLRAIAMVGLATADSFALTAALALLAGCGTALYRPVAAAAMPTLAGRELQAQAAAARSLINNVAAGLGPALAALVFLLGTPEDALLIDAGTFLISAAVLARTRLDPPTPATRKDASEPAGFRAGVREGVVAVREIPGLWQLLAVVQMVLLFGGMIGVAEPLLAKNVLHGGNAGFAALSTAFAVGLILGGYAAADTPDSRSRLKQSYVVGLAVAALGLCFTAIAPSLIVATAASALTGIGNDYSLTRQEQLLQLVVPERLLGRVFGLKDTVSGVALAGAFMLGGVTASTIGARGVFAISAGGILLAALTGLIPARGGIENRAPETAEPVWGASGPDMLASGGVGADVDGAAPPAEGVSAPDAGVVGADLP